MFYKYRVTLEGIKGFYRVYLIDGENSLYKFHKQLRADLEFPADQQILFKAFDEAGNVVARYALIDIGSGTVDNVSISQTIRNGIVKFVYFYDVVSKKSVTITFEGEETDSRKKTVAGPEIIDTKGPVPIAFEQGYVAFEDMPEERRRLPGEKLGGEDEEDDDLDDEDDEEDNDDEDGDEEKEEIIYDEEEGL